MLKNLLKKLGGDFILSVSAVVIFNGVIQFLLNPYLTEQLGAEKFGTVLLQIIPVWLLPLKEGAQTATITVIF